MSKEKKVQSFFDKFTIKNFVLVGAISALLSSGLWGSIAYGVLHLEMWKAFAPIIILIALAIPFGIAANSKSGGGEKAMGVIIFFVYMCSAYSILQLALQVLDKFLQWTHSVWLVVLAINETLRIYFSGYLNALQIVANNQSSFLDSPYGHIWFGIEVVAGLLACVVSIAIYIAMRWRYDPESEGFMKVKWSLLIGWLFYATLRGFQTMLPLFVLSILVDMYLEKIILRPILKRGSKAGHVAAQKHGRFAVNVWTATIISTSIFIVQCTYVCLYPVGKFYLHFKTVTIPLTVYQFLPVVCFFDA